MDKDSGKWCNEVLSERNKTVEQMFCGICPKKIGITGQNVRKNELLIRMKDCLKIKIKVEEN